MQKKSFIDKVRVKDPCTQAWDEMVGNDKVRFCTHCAKDVNNLSAMTRKEAVRLVRKSGGSLCIRYVQQPRTKQPMFAEQLTQITRRRVPLMAAGVMSASLSLATMTYAQGGAVVSLPRNEPVAAKVSECEDVPKADSRWARTGADNSVDKDRKNGSAAVESNAILRGTVVDANGAVVPNTGVSLMDSAGSVLGSLRTDDNGAFRFDRLSPGTYSLQTEASGGFAATRVENIAVGEFETAVDITVNVVSQAVVVGGMGISVEFESPLAIAVSNDDLEDARDLISRGENVNGKEEDGTTPLFIAVENGNLDMVKLLLDSGARVNMRNKDKHTAVMGLDADSSAELVELLIRFGAKVNQRSKNGSTALMRAAAQAPAGVVKALIDAGADLDAQNEDGMTALMFAADEDNLETARILVLAGANINLKDNDGDTAWDKTSNEELEALLESYGAVIDDEP
jgi:hypothetical protein